MELVKKMLYERLKPQVEKTLNFHVKNAPGVVIGVYMVDLALELLDGLYPDRKSYVLNALCETNVCLADPIQVLTGCTFGNKYLRLNAVDNGRYALVLYNRDTSLGFRVFVDLKKINGEKFPELYAFFYKTRDYSSRSRSLISKATIEEFYRAERQIFSCQKVKVNIPAKDDLVPAAVCRNCGESYLVTPAKKKSGQNLCAYCEALAAGADLLFEILE